MAVTHPPSGCAGSTPARRTRHGSFVYRHRTSAPHAEKAGSTPARATEHDQVAQLADARRSERRAARHGSSTLPLVTDTLQARQVPDAETRNTKHEIRNKSKIPNPNEIGNFGFRYSDFGFEFCGWASAQPGLISLDGRVRPPDPPRPGTRIGIAARSRASCLWVRLPPRSLRT